jgi:hypothetical protein
MRVYISAPGHVASFNNRSETPLQPGCKSTGSQILTLLLLDGRRFPKTLGVFLPDAASPKRGDCRGGLPYNRDLL